MATNSSKYIPGEQIAGARAWSPPSMDPKGRPPQQASLKAPPTLEQLEELQRQAQEEGFAEGREAGFAQGRREALAELRGRVDAMRGRLDQVLGALDTPFKQLDDQVEHELVTLVIAMVRQLVRREIRTDPNHVIGVVREALAILPVGSRNVRLVLHPEDATLVREIYTIAEAEPGWSLVEDPVMQRGGCRVLTETSQVDATLESRLAAIIAPLMHGERSSDGGE